LAGLLDVIPSARLLERLSACRRPCRTTSTTARWPRCALSGSIRRAISSIQTRSGPAGPCVQGILSRPKRQRERVFLVGHHAAAWARPWPPVRPQRALVIALDTAFHGRGAALGKRRADFVVTEVSEAGSLILAPRSPHTRMVLLVLE